MKFLLYVLTSKGDAVWHTSHIYNLLTPKYIKSLNKNVFVKNIDYLPGNDWTIEIEEIATRKQSDLCFLYEPLDTDHFFKNHLYVYLVFGNEIDATLYKLFLDK